MSGLSRLSGLFGLSGLFRSLNQGNRIDRTPNRPDRPDEPERPSEPKSLTGWLAVQAQDLYYGGLSVKSGIVGVADGTQREGGTAH